MNNPNIQSDIQEILNNKELSNLVKAGELIALCGDYTPEELAIELNISLQEAKEIIEIYTID